LTTKQQTLVNIDSCIPFIMNDHLNPRCTGTGKSQSAYNTNIEVHAEFVSG